jgi:hypothetical protein
MSKKIILENEMDQAEAVLAAKAVTDTLQDMAEKIAKLEANNIMPLLDTIRMNFGPEFSQQLSADATAALQNVVAAIKGAKDQIGANIDKMQNVITGENSGNDMATNAGVPGEELPTAPAAPAEPAAPEAGGEAPETPAAPAAPAVSNGDLDDVFSDAPTPDRAKKESIQARSINMLRESEDPDQILLAATVMRMKHGMKGIDAIQETAQQFGVDAEDIIALVREGRHLENGFMAKYAGRK